jgi:hypothetical protein
VRRGDLSGRKRFNAPFDESVVGLERILAVETIYIVALRVISREIGRTNIKQQFVDRLICFLTVSRVSSRLQLSFRDVCFCPDHILVQTNS